MTHLIIWSSLRAGSHMLRSMLRDDPMMDSGEIVYALPAEIDRFGEERGHHMLNIKFGISEPMMVLTPLPELLAAVRRIDDVRVLLLHRRDLLAQQASFRFALENGFAFIHPPKTRRPVTLSPNHDGPAMFRCAMDLAWLQANLDGIRNVTLAYEDLTAPALVSAALRHLLGRPVTVVAPDTTKSAPASLADFVRNLDKQNPFEGLVR